MNKFSKKILKVKYYFFKLWIIRKAKDTTLGHVIYDRLEIEDEGCAKILLTGDFLSKDYQGMTLQESAKAKLYLDCLHMKNK